MRQALRVAFVLAALETTSAQGAQPAPKPAAAAPRPMHCALVDGSERSPLCALVEARLLERGTETWVERTALDKLLREQQVQKLFGAEAGRDRSALGRLAKAEVLILLRPEERDKIKQLDVTVCETTLGLRLLAVSHPLGTNGVADAEAIVALVAGALDKARREIREVWTIPPFLSQDLGYRFDYLKDAYARLLEQSVLDRGGYVVVELAEAQAVSRELALAGGKAVARAVPLTVLGEYRHEGAAADARSQLTLRLMRGEKELDRAVHSDVARADAPQRLKDSLARFVQAVSKANLPALPADPRGEARRLADRAQASMRLGQWSQALGPLEASLLLDSGQESVRHLAIVVLTAVVAKEWRVAPRTPRGLSYYRRNLEHVERFAKSKPELDKYRLWGGGDFLGNAYYQAIELTEERFPPELRVEVREIRDMQREMMLGLCRECGRLNERRFLMWAYAGLAPKERMDLIVKMVDELKDTPGAAARTVDFALQGRVASALDLPEGRDLMARLEGIKHPDVQQGIATLRRRIEQSKKDQTVQTPDPVFETGGPDRFTVAAVPFRWSDDADGTSGKFESFNGGCIPAGAGVDVVWGSSSLYLMRSPGVLRRVWTGHKNVLFNKVVFDGRYVWATAHRFTNLPLVLVLDPKTELVVEFDKADGLPLLSSEEVEKAPLNEGRFVSCAAVSPGTACIVGSFGQTWIALASYDPQKGKTVRMIHEAREVPTRDATLDWRNAKLAFAPKFALRLSPNDPAAGSRLVVGRTMPGEGSMHPLVFDPARPAPTVFKERLWGMGSNIAAVVAEDYVTIHQGSMYWLRPGETKVELMRLGFPGESLETVVQEAREGWLLAAGGKVHILGRQWWTADLKGGKLELAVARPPWKFSTRFGASRPSEKIQPGATMFVSAWVSQHHGVLVMTRDPLAMLGAPEAGKDEPPK